MRVYVAYLATDGGRDAVVLGTQLARTLAGDLAIGMVVPPDTAAALTAGDYTSEVLTEQADEWLARARELVPDDIETTTHIGIYDSPAEGIIAEATRVGAQLIVLGATGGGVLGTHSLGAVANELIHAAPLPVALAPRGTRRSEARTLREVTCAVGGRAGAQNLIAAAIRGCERAGLPLRMVSLIALDRLPSQRRSDPVALREATAHAQHLLDEARGLLPGGLEITSAVVDGPSVEDAVSKLRWRPGDIIMVGSSRLAAPRRLFLGSTAARMLRVLQVPMVVVPREEF